MQRAARALQGVSRPGAEGGAASHGSEKPPDAAVGAVWAASAQQKSWAALVDLLHGIGMCLHAVGELKMVGKLFHNWSLFPLHRCVPFCLCLEWD